MSEIIDVQEIANLARLKLNEGETAYLQKQFQAIKGYIDKISEVQVDAQMMEKDESAQQVYHEDRTQISEVSPEQFSPYVENHFFKVPKVLE